MDSHWGIDVRNRHLRPEWMDRPGLDVALHRSALRGLERVNWLSLIHHTFWPAIRQLAKSRPTREVRMLDVACGGGDVAVRLVQKSQQSQFRVTVDGCDLSPTAISFARERAERSQVPCRFFEFDVLRDEWPTDYDVIGTSLFLHHLTTETAIGVLARMAAATRHIVLVNDLVRSRKGYLLARFASRLLTRSPIVHSDGPASVAGAFTTDELRDVARRAGLNGAIVSPRWPARMLLQWSKP